MYDNFSQFLPVEAQIKSWNIPAKTGSAEFDLVYGTLVWKRQKDTHCINYTIIFFHTVMQTHSYFSETSLTQVTHVAKFPEGKFASKE